MTMTRARQALGSQIREALDSMKDAGSVVDWKMTSSEREGLRYVITTPVTQNLDATTAPLTPGGCMDWLNRRGFDIYIGKA